MRQNGVPRDKQVREAFRSAVDASIGCWDSCISVGGGTEGWGLYSQWSL